MTNQFEKYVNESLDASGRPVEPPPLAIIDERGEVWSTSIHDRHTVVLAQKRALRRLAEGYQIRQQIGWLANWGLMLLMILLIALFAVTFIVIG